ncbi:MAG: phosphatidate cytidylyltransferase [Actinomycetota bacterium]|nr:phosphatidate cytidylyltransferase [Actinomycetota bacterium]
MDDHEIEDRETTGAATVPVEYPVTERVRIVGAQPAGEALVGGAPAGDELDEPVDAVAAAGRAQAAAAVRVGADAMSVGQPQTAIQGDLDEPGRGQPIGTGSDDPEAGGGRLTAPDMPHWTDPPTGQVPAILDRAGDPDDPWSAVLGGGPAWREHPHEWEDVSFEPSLLADEGTRVGVLGSGHGDLDPSWAEDDEPGGAWDEVGIAGSSDVLEPGAGWGDAPSGLADDAEGPVAPGDSRPGDPLPATTSLDSPPAGAGAGTGSVADRTPGDGERSGSPVRHSSSPVGERSARRRGGAARRGRARPAGELRTASRTVEPPGAVVEGGPSRRSVPVAIGTGLVFAVVALASMAAGPRYVMILVTVVVVAAAAELYGALHKAGHRPATLVGLVGTVAIMVAAYDRGVGALPLVTVLVVITTMLWYLFRIGRGSPIEGIGATVMAFAWVGLLGSFASLLLAPGLFPDRHGVAFIFGAIVAVAANDIGALAIGAWLGRHPLAPSVSPNKTWEGAVGGAVLTLVVSIFVTGHVHPWTPGSAAVLGAIVAVVAPLGDLCESLVKRELGVKDMGTVLPGHGGLLDRFDALFFVLPATFFLVRALHLG